MKIILKSIDLLSYGFRSILDLDDLDHFKYNVVKWQFVKHIIWYLHVYQVTLYPEYQGVRFLWAEFDKLLKGAFYDLFSELLAANCKPVHQLNPAYFDLGRAILGPSQLHPNIAFAFVSILSLNWLLYYELSFDRCVGHCLAEP